MHWNSAFDWITWYLNTCTFWHMCVRVCLNICDSYSLTSYPNPNIFHTLCSMQCIHITYSFGRIWIFHISCLPHCREVQQPGTAKYWALIVIIHLPNHFEYIKSYVNSFNVPNKCTAPDTPSTCTIHTTQCTIISMYSDLINWKEPSNEIKRLQ